MTERGGRGRPAPDQPTQPVAEALTAEELAALRRNHTGPEMQCRWDMQPRPCMYERLLATLDAAREGHCASCDGHACPDV